MCELETYRSDDKYGWRIRFNGRVLMKCHKAIWNSHREAATGYANSVETLHRGVKRGKSNG